MQTEYPKNPKVIGFISFYNEKNHIIRCLESIYDFCDQVVLIDGAYENFPYGKRPWSTDGTLGRIENFIKMEKDNGDSKVILVRTKSSWPTEVAKRNQLFQFGAPGDWYLIADADMELKTNAYGTNKVRKMLFKQLDDHIIQVGLQCVTEPSVVGGYTPSLQRHVDGVAYRHNHYTFYNHLTEMWFGNPFRHIYHKHFYIKLDRAIPFIFFHHGADAERQELKDQYYKRARTDERHDWWNFI